MDNSPTDRLQQTEQQLRPLIENATDIVTVLNADGTRRYVSPSVEHLLGYRPEELIGKSAFDLVHPEDHTALQALLASDAANEGGVVTRQFRIRARNGDWRIHEATAHNLLSDASVQGVVVNSRDITSRKLLERRLTMQFEAAQVLAESKSLQTAAPRLLRTICEGADWDLGQLWVVDRQVKKLRWLASWQAEGVGSGEFVVASRNRFFDHGAGLPGRIWDSGSSEWITEIASDRSFPRVALAVQATLHSAFGFPIKLGEDVLGVMEFFSTERRPADDSLLGVMTAIGNQIGQFYEREHSEEERSKLYEREQRARLELEATMQRMRQVQTVTEVALSHLSVDKLLTELLDR